MGKMLMKCLMAVLVLTVLLSALNVCAVKSENINLSGVTVYFPNWNVYSDSRNQVKNLPWDRLDSINHAFWKIVPEDGSYKIVSTDPWADIDESNPVAHFPQYARLAQQHPNVKILLSIGGWTECGYFSEMALTAESRASFIQSCIDTLECYPFLSGLDIDWEYPGIARSGGPGDEGNPVKGDDKANYTLLLKELREALDEHFAEERKILTVCAGGSLSTLSHQDYAALFPYVDRINLMTYDMAGTWNSYTGHHSPLYGAASADAAVNHLLSLGVPAAKIAIGSPLYSHGWKLYRPADKPVGAAAKSLSDGDLTWNELSDLESAAVAQDANGWRMGYDEEAEAAYLWNDDIDSPQYLYFYTYESSRSLEAKLQYINDHGLGGLIVWQVHGDGYDGADWPMITQMYKALHP